MFRRARRRGQQGFLIMAAVFLVVVVGAFVGYLATQSTVQQVSAIEDLESARALQAARAGIEWGSYQVLRNASCAGTNLTFAGTSLAEFTATVTCTASGSLTEAGTTVVIYKVTSNACNLTPCPNTATTSPLYVDREISVSIARCTAGC
jgi:MSHA biogenesis protein MshP